MESAETLSNDGMTEWGPDTNNVFHPKIPPRYQNDKLVKGEVYYGIPRTLVIELIRECKRRAFGSRALAREIAVYKSLRFTPEHVGFDADGEPIYYSHLSPEAAPVGELLAEYVRIKQAQSKGRPREDPDELGRIAQDRFDYNMQATRGYLGWLVTNPTFLEERDALFTQWKLEIQKNGIPRSGPTMFGPIKHTELITEIRKKNTKSYLADFASFYARWRLQHLVTRELPEPLQPKIPILQPLSLLTHLEAGGISYYQPDTVPIPPRDEIRGHLEDLRKSRGGEHLGEWKEVVSTDRGNDHALRRYSRIFVLHFYWKILDQRHPKIFTNRVTKIKSAFGSFLGADVKTVEAIRTQIRQRLNQAP